MRQCVFRGAWIRSAAAAAAAAVLVVCASFDAGCARTPRVSSPYAPASEGDRNNERAQQLNQEAAKLIDTKPERAEKLLREALTADLYYGPAHNNLGVLYLKQGKLYEAAGEFEWARKLMPGHPDPRLNLALTLERAGRTDEALSTYASALEVYPDHLPTMQALALLQLKSGRTDARTPKLLDEVAFRSESQQWREWARFQRAKTGS